MLSNQADIIHQSNVTLIIALSETTVGKVVFPNPMIFVNQDGEPVDLFNKKDAIIATEMMALQYANSVNDLMPQLIIKTTWQEKPNSKKWDMMVMERLYPLPINHFDLPTRQIMIKEFEQKLTALHNRRFVHGDFIRPTNYW